MSFEIPSLLFGGSSFIYDNVKWTIEDSDDFVLEIIDDEEIRDTGKEDSSSNVLMKPKKKVKGPEPKFISNSPEFFCSKCNRAFTTSFALKRHNAVQHGVIDDFKAHLRCRECNRIFFCKDELNRHMIKIHNCTDTVIYRCHVCNRLFPSRYELARHNVKHHEEKIVPCPYCDDMFSRHFLLRDHMKRNHTSALHAKCRTCNEMIPFIDMDSHVAKEHSTTWTCTVCSQVFLKQSIMIQHELEEHMG